MRALMLAALLAGSCVNGVERRRCDEQHVGDEKVPQAENAVYRCRAITKSVEHVDADGIKYTVFAPYDYAWVKVTIGNND